MSDPHQSFILGDTTSHSLQSFTLILSFSLSNYLISHSALILILKWLDSMGKFDSDIVSPGLFSKESAQINHLENFLLMMGIRQTHVCSQCNNIKFKAKKKKNMILKSTYPYPVSMITGDFRQKCSFVCDLYKQILQSAL